MPETKVYFLEGEGKSRTLVTLSAQDFYARFPFDKRAFPHLLITPTKDPDFPIVALSGAPGWHVRMKGIEVVGGVEEYDRGHILATDCHGESTREGCEKQSCDFSILAEECIRHLLISVSDCKCVHDIRERRTRLPF